MLLDGLIERRGMVGHTHVTHGEMYRGYKGIDDTSIFEDADVGQPWAYSDLAVLYTVGKCPVGTSPLDWLVHVHVVRIYSSIMEKYVSGFPRRKH